MRYIKLQGKKGLGLATVVDDGDFEALNRYKWYLNASGYACATVYHGGGRDNKRQSSLRMHRLLVDGSPPQVDHINGNKLDNQRSNLREATNQTNRMNQFLRINNRSGYKGVWFDAKLGKYQSYIRYQGKRFHICVTPDIEEAAWMYDQWALNFFGDFANPNLEYLS